MRALLAAACAGLLLISNDPARAAVPPQLLPYLARSPMVEEIYCGGELVMVSAGSPNGIPIQAWDPGAYDDPQELVERVRQRLIEHYGVRPRMMVTTVPEEICAGPEA